MLKLNRSFTKKNSLFLLILLICIVVTNLSQLPYLVDKGLGRYISTPVWIILFLLVFFAKQIRLTKSIFLISLCWIFFIIFIFLADIFGAKQYIGSTFVYPFTLSIFIFIIGNSLARKISPENFTIIVWGYILSGLLVTFAVYIDSFIEGFSWNSRAYLYSSKNSVSQIIVTTIILILVFYLPNKISLNFGKWIMLLFPTLQLLMLKSRASILGLFLIILIQIFVDKRDKSGKKMIATIFIIFLLLLISNNNFFDFFTNNILFAQRNTSDLNDLSSGRWQMFENFPSLFRENFLIGSGESYMESFPLSVLVHYGIIGSLSLVIVSIWPLYYAISKLQKTSSINIAFLMIAVTYFINGLFEEQAPFGPGAKCYFLWLLFGLLKGWNGNKRMTNNSKL